MSITNFLLILGMAAVTYVSRAVPLVMFSSQRLNSTIERWLQLIPPAVLAALLVPELVIDKTEAQPLLHISVENIMLMAAIPSFLTAWFTRNFFGTVAVGMGSVALGRYLLAIL